jgi:lysylphosphatidylglycerol synthetase-like protein (DUF2156 family)
VALVLLWFVLGYVFYSVVFAAVGALVSRQEDLQTAMLPVNALLIAAFYLALIVSGNPNGVVAQITAFIPPFSPMIVPMRMVLGDMTVPALVLAVVINLIAIVGLTVLAGGIYERAILRIGAPVKLREMLERRAGRLVPSRPGNVSPERRRWVELAMRAAAIVLLLGAVVIGFEHAVAIVFVVLGIALVVVLQSRGQGPRRSAH